MFVTKTNSLSQFNENTLVKGELDLLTDTDTVYKLVGPVLMSVDLMEAKENVSKRIEFIEGEIKKIDGAITAKQAQQTDLGEEIRNMQTDMQKNAAEAATAAGQAAQAAA
jgi:prefoldin beta subunit